jgi:Type IV secretion-system coupling protein DNA-binding domain
MSTAATAPALTDLQPVDASWIQADLSPRSHIQIVGTAGTGKSSLLYDLLLQCIQQGDGIIAIDPNTDFRELSDKLPHRRQVHIASGSTSFQEDMPELAATKSSTLLPQNLSTTLRQKIGAIFAEAKEEVFEDGMESQFSRALTSAIRQFGNAAIRLLAGLILFETVNAESASEALRWLGHMNHPPTHRARLWLLERSLQSSSPTVRDGAALGLAFLEDRRAMPYLQEAIERERSVELQHDLRQVLAQLESRE